MKKDFIAAAVLLTGTLALNAQKVTKFSTTSFNTYLIGK